MTKEKFQKACESWKKKYCKNKKTARKKLQEMGMIDKYGKLTKPYA